MAALKAHKKGAFLALGLTLFALTLLSLSVVVLRYATADEQTLTILNTMDRMYELKSSIDRGFFKIFNAKSGITLNITGQRIEFKETMPNANNQSLSASLTSYESFIESNYPQAGLDLGLVASEVPLIIKPYNVTYRHKSFGGKEIQIEGVGMSGYILTVILQENVTGCTIEDSNPGSTNVTLQAFGTFGTSCSAFQQVNPSQHTNIEVDGAAGENISLDLNNNLMRIRAESLVSVFSVLQFNGTEPLHVEFPDATLQISYPDFNVNTKTSVRII